MVDVRLVTWKPRNLLVLLILHAADGAVRVCLETNRHDILELAGELRLNLRSLSLKLLFDSSLTNGLNALVLSNLGECLRMLHLVNSFDFSTVMV